MSGVEVVTQGEVTQSQIDQLLALNNVVVVLPNLTNLINLSELSFENIIEAIRMAVEFIETGLRETPFYDQNIPIINRRVSEAFDFINDLLDKLQQAAEDPASFIQEVENIIENALGITDNNGLPVDDQIFSFIRWQHCSRFISSGIGTFRHTW